jgi:hypothetical protein
MNHNLSLETITKLETLGVTEQAVFLKWYFFDKLIKEYGYSNATLYRVKGNIQRTLNVNVNHKRFQTMEQIVQ